MVREPFEGILERDWHSATNGTIRFAVIGLGGWTQNRAIPALNATEHCDVTVAVSGSEAKATNVTEQWPTIEHGITYEAFHDGAATESYDAVYICTPNATHLDYVSRAAALGKDILCEKPMEVSVERARQMIGTCDDQGVELMIGYRMQTEPLVRRLRELIQQEFIGDPVQIHGHISNTLLNETPGSSADPDQWRLDPALSGGTTLIDIGLYPLNTTRFILDENPRGLKAEVYSEHESFDGADEHVSLQLAFPESVSAVCTASFSATETSYLNVIGSDGEAMLRPAFFPWNERALSVTRDETTYEVSSNQIDQMEEEFDYFADRILSNREPYPNGWHGLVDIEIVEAVYESRALDQNIVAQN
jgi:xylose dehydrogenase (NAD/NADP)